MIAKMYNVLVKSIYCCSEEDTDVFDNDPSESSAPTTTDEENESETETNNMVENVYDQFEDVKIAKINALTEEGYDEEEANQAAHRMLLPQYRKAFREKFKQTFLRMEQLRREPLYKEIADTAKELRSEGLSREESIKAAVSKRKHKMNEYIASDFESEQDSGDADGEQEDKNKMKNKINGY